MRGHRERSGSLFSYVSIEERIPTSHPLRRIRTLADQALARLNPTFCRLYPEGGRPLIPPERLLLAGFSQGGAITLAAGLRRQVPLAGLIALSTYLPGASQAARHRVAAATAQPVFMAHGTGDPVIPLIHAEQSAQALGELGFDVEWHRYPMAHQVCAEEIRDLGDWMGRRFAL